MRAARKNVKCRVHPKYKAIRKPVATKKHSGGCAECWGIYNEKHPHG